MKQRKNKNMKNKNNQNAAKHDRGEENIQSGAEISGILQWDRANFSTTLCTVEPTNNGHPLKIDATVEKGEKFTEYVQHER